MLSDIKKKSTGWIGNFIIAILSLMVCLGGMQYYLTSTNREVIVVTVDGNDITKRALDKVYQINKVSLESAPDAEPLTQNELVALKQDLLEMLIANQLKLNYAGKNGMWVPEVVRDKYLYSQDIFKEDNKFSVARYQKIVNAVAGSESAYLAQITNDLLSQQLVVGVTNTAFVLPGEIASIAELVNESRNIRYIRLSPNDITYTPASAAAIAEYYNSHQDDFINEAKVKVEYVLIDNNDIHFAPSASEIESFYQNNNNLFPDYKSVTYNIYTVTGSNDDNVAADITKLQQLTASDNASEALLEQYMVDHKKIAVTDSAKASSIADITAKGAQNRLASMQPSDVTAYESDGSLIILQLKDADMIPYAKLSSAQKQLVLDNYIIKNTELKFAKLVDEVNDLAYTEDNLTNIAKVAGAKISTSDYFTAAKGNSLLAKNENVRKMAFSDELLVDKLNSSVIKLDANKVVVFRVKDYQPSKPQTLVEAKPKIVKKLEEESIKTALNLKADRIIKEKNNSFKWTQLNNIAREGIISRFAMEIRDDVFQMPIGSAAKTTLKNGDVVVIDVLSKGLPQKKVTMSELEYKYKNYWAKWDLYGFENSLRSQAKVKYIQKVDKP